MATRKVTITIPDDQLNQIRALVAARRAPTVSAFVTRAIATALLDAAGWQAMLDQALEETGGPLTRKERAWADSFLKAPAPKRRRKRTAA